MWTKREENRFFDFCRQNSNFAWFFVLFALNYFLYFGGEYVTITIIFSSLFKASTHLIWSVFGLTNPETMESRDNLSTTVVGVLYVMFLILSVIMLVNMLVALLTNTYNKVEVSNYLPSFLYPIPESYEHFL